MQCLSLKMLVLPCARQRNRTQFGTAMERDSSVPISSPTFAYFGSWNLLVPFSGIPWLPSVDLLPERSRATCLPIPARTSPLFCLNLSLVLPLEVLSSLRSPTRLPLKQLPRFFPLVLLPLFFLRLFTPTVSFFHLLSSRVRPRLSFSGLSGEVGETLARWKRTGDYGLACRGTFVCGP